MSGITQPTDPDLKAAEAAAAAEAAEATREDAPAPLVRYTSYFASAWRRGDGEEGRIGAARGYLQQVAVALHQYWPKFAPSDPIVGSRIAARILTYFGVPYASTKLWMNWTAKAQSGIKTVSLPYVCLLTPVEDAVRADDMDKLDRLVTVVDKGRQCLVTRIELSPGLPNPVVLGQPVTLELPHPGGWTRATGQDAFSLTAGPIAPMESDAVWGYNVFKAADEVADWAAPLNWGESTIMHEMQETIARDFA